jgi:murein DD-endopeptidase MepM/ murein hydrolase activator NlpD
VRAFLAAVTLVLLLLVGLFSWSLVHRTRSAGGAGSARDAAARPQTGPVAAVPAAKEPVPPVASPSPDVPVLAADLARLRARGLLVPVQGLEPRQLRDTFEDARTGHLHEALDLVAPRGTPVLAADDGVVRKLFTSRYGGLTVYQFDPSETYCYYYAHLDRYAEGLAEGRLVRRGERIGYVGTTGNAPPQTPHLHFAIFKLGPERRWWEGVAINPFPVWAGGHAS